MSETIVPEIPETLHEAREEVEMAYFDYNHCGYSEQRFKRLEQTRAALLLEVLSYGDSRASAAVAAERARVAGGLFKLLEDMSSNASISKLEDAVHAFAKSLTDTAATTEAP